MELQLLRLHLQELLPEPELELELLLEPELLPELELLPEDSMLREFYGGAADRRAQNADV